MALTRIRTHIRPLLIGVAVVGAVAVAIPTVASATPGTPPAPTVASVTTKLEQLSERTEVLAEQFNKAQSDVTAKQKEATAAQQAAAQSVVAYQAARALFGRTLAAQYEGTSFSSTGALLSSRDGQNYLDRVSSMGLLSVHRADVVGQVTAAKAQAAAAQKKAAALLADATAKRDALAKQKTQILAETDKYKSLLATLTLAEQQAYRTRNAVATTQAQVPSVASTIKVHAGNAAAQKAVDFALKQVGKAYVFAASGPDAFDCSGLTAAAWAQGGVELPHLASSQYDYGTHVDVSQLQPGDLVFLYSPITHVEIYIGNGMAVSAADEELGIRIVNISQDMGSYVGATRLT